MEVDPQLAADLKVNCRLKLFGISALLYMTACSGPVPLSACQVPLTPIKGLLPVQLNVTHVLIVSMSAPPGPYPFALN